MINKLYKYFFLLIICGVSVSAQNTGINNKSGSTLRLSTGTVLTITGNWINAGTFTPGAGTVVFKGASGNQSVTNSSGETFTNFTVNKASGNVLLQNNCTVNGNLTVTLGDLDMNGRTITLGAAALISETAGNTIKGSGSITGTVNLNAPNSVNAFGLGGIITSAANLGSTVITRTHTAQTGGSGISLLRSYNIAPAANTGLNAAFVFSYDDSELNGNAEANLKFFNSTNSGTNWTIQGGNVIAIANTVTLTGINSFALWTAADQSAPLPVELSSFDGKVIDNNTVLLNWETVTEQNNHGYEVEKLLNPDTKDQKWSTAGFIAGNGNSNSVKEYTFKDEIKYYSGKVKYRLKQIDNDGNFRYSDAVEVEITAPKEFTLYQNYPNPFNPETSIKFTVAESGLTQLSIFNSLGELVETIYNQYSESGKYNEIRFNASKLTSGVYLVHLRSGSRQTVKKMVYIK